jgi:hypothetical protein
VTTEAIRKADPNHLVLGSRYFGAARNSPGMFRAAGRYLDVISFNYYGIWTPEESTMARWLEWSGKPFMVTEFYTKGVDAGLPNTTGAGWIVPTQKDRGVFYQNYCLGLLTSANCVGWHWFRYMDNDPGNPKAEPSNLDSNKGIVTTGFQIYPELAGLMQELNREAYPLREYLSRAPEHL